MSAELLAALQPALDRYAAELARHSHINLNGRPDHEETTEEFYARIEAGIRPACACGWEPRENMQAKSKSRAVGIHITAAEKRASKAYDVDAGRIIDERARAERSAR